MTIVPEIVEKFLSENQQWVEQWISERVYRQLVARSPHHRLVRLSALLDFGPLEAGCQGYAHTSGPGAKPTHSVARLVRAVTVKYLFNWSLRETEDYLHYHLLLRWFVGYGLLAAVPDHSTLERFEQWLRAHQPRLFFDTILQQVDQAFPELRQGAQIGDTYACRANAAQEDTVRLLRHTSRRLLEFVEHASPPLHATVLGQLDGERLFGPADERNEYYLSETERVERQQHTVAGAWQLQQLVRGQLDGVAEPLKTMAQQRVADLEKIIADEFQLSQGADGQLSAVVARDAKHKGEYRLHSATDREATVRNHGHDCTLGYNISVAINPDGFIREIQAASGAEPDQAGVAALIRVQKEQHQLCPTKLIYDQAAGAGRTRAEVRRVSAGQTQLVARIPPPSVRGRYTPADFHFQAEGVLACPAERITGSKQRASDRDGWLYAFRGKTCQGCPLWSQCREETARPNGPRRVFISDYQDELRQAQAYNHSAAFTQDMRLRQRVERVIFMLTHYDGARRARCRGLPAADFQAKMCATVRNLRTWLKRLDQLELAL